MLKMTRQEYQSRDYEFDEIEDDPRLVRAKKEMIITFTSYFIYVVIMLYVCYYFAAKDMAEMQYLFGLPRYLSVLCIIAVIGAVCIMSLSHIVFKAEDLQDEIDDESGKQP
ncbi:MAG: DUF997 family protein [Candidatus Aphodousia sp.]|nr:YhdT family protein [Sutterella sp.]MDY2899742.1 DUF997 family protein [Candidatus Aphodousia sp.]